MAHNKRKQGEISTLIALVSVSVILLGLFIGRSGVETTKKLSGKAQTPCFYDSTNQIRYKGKVLTGVSGFTWKNNFTLPNGDPITGEFKVASPESRLENIWQTDLNSSEAQKYKNQIAWVELTKKDNSPAKEYEIVGTFCDTTGSSDSKTCELFCKDNLGSKTSCQYGFDHATARINGLLISCGGKLVYGWEVLKKSEITPTPTIKPSPSVLPSPTPLFTPPPTISPKTTPTHPPIQDQPNPTPSNECLETVGSIHGKIKIFGGPLPSGVNLKVSACKVVADSSIDCTTEYGFGLASSPNWDYTISNIPTSGQVGVFLWRSYFDQNGRPIRLDPAASSSTIDCTGNGKQQGNFDRDCLISLSESGNAECDISQDYQFSISKISPTRIPTQTIAPIRLPTDTPIPTRRPTTAPLPTNPPNPPRATPTPSSCRFDATTRLWLKSKGTITDFNAINNHNRLWYTTSDLSSDEGYFKKGKIDVHVDNFTPPAPSTCVQLHYDTSQFRIVEVRPGPGTKGDFRKTGASSPSQTSDTICSLPLTCPLTPYEFGWVVERINTSPPPNFKVAFLGDQGLTGQQDALPDKVLSLIKNEGANMVVFLGDFDYVRSPSQWEGMIKSSLGTGIPILAVAGNHDVEDIGVWSQYQTMIRSYIQSIPDVYCDDLDNIGITSTCTFKGLTFILSGVGVDNVGPWPRSSDTASYIKDQLDKSDSSWKVCAWHRNMPEMQLGAKTETYVGWEPYEACREMGAIVATAHEHSYHRTKTLTNIPNRTVDSSCSDGANVCVAPGKTFVFVSGLGGAGERRVQVRCGKDNKISADCPEWAAIYANPSSKTKSKSGALFIAFNVDGNSNKARGYFKTYDGEVKDNFTITNGPTSSSPGTPPSGNLPTQGLSLHFNIVNNYEKTIVAIEFNVCRLDTPNDCQLITKTISVLPKGTVDLIEQAQTDSKNRYSVSCSIIYDNGTRQPCSSKSIRGDNSLSFSIVAKKDGSIESIVKTERELCDLNHDKECNALDFAIMIANYNTPRGDMNGDKTTNALDVSLWHKWVDVHED